MADVVRAKESARSKPLKLTVFASFLNPDIEMIGTEQARQILRESLVIATFAMRNLGVREFFYTLFLAGQSSVAVIGES